MIIFVHISVSVTIEEQKRRRDMRCIDAAGKARGVDVKLKVKIVTTKDGVAFQSHHAYLSNMFPCKIMFEGVEYKSAELLYHPNTAKHHNRFDLVNRIIKAKDGYATKRIAEEIDFADDWDEVKLKIMCKVINLKFDPHDGLRDKLLATIGHLYEATKGDSFSCGLKPIFHCDAKPLVLGSALA